MSEEQNIPGNPPHQRRPKRRKRKEREERKGGKGNDAPGTSVFHLAEASEKAKVSARICAREKQKAKENNHKKWEAERKRK